MEINKSSIIKKFDKIQSNYQKKIGIIKTEIEQYFEFEFYIEWQASDDCFMVIYEDENAPIDDCIDIIIEKGIVSENDYFNICR